MVDYLADYEADTVLLAVRPSGWEKHRRNNFGSRLSIVGIEYSEHSSYDELDRFVRFLMPTRIIPTVPVSCKDLNRMPALPAAWTEIHRKAPKPRIKSYQMGIDNFLIAKSTAVENVWSAAATNRDANPKSVVVVDVDDDARNDDVPLMQVDEVCPAPVSNGSSSNGLVDYMF